MHQEAKTGLVDVPSFSHFAHSVISLPISRPRMLVKSGFRVRDLVVLEGLTFKLSSFGRLQRNLEKAYCFQPPHV